MFEHQGLYNIIELKYYHPALATCRENTSLNIQNNKYEKFPLIDVAGNLTVCDTEQEVDINWLGHLKTISHLSVTCRGYIASCYYKFDKNPEAFLKPETHLEVLSPGRSKFTANVSHPKKACSAGRKI